MALSKSPYRGTRDFFPQDMRLRNFIFQKMAKVSELFAYEPYDGPLLEEVELYLAKSGEELINEQIYSFTDRGERRVAIRPEMTPTVARMVAQIHREVAKPLRWYAIPNLMRYEKMQKARLREFWQYNADIFGGGELGDLEILQLAIAIYQSFGADHRHFEVLINDRRLVDHVFNTLLALSPEVSGKLYKLVDRKNKMEPAKFSAEVRALIPDEKKASQFEAYTSLASAADIVRFMGSVPEDSPVAPLLRLLQKVQDSGIGEYIKFDPSIVRGLDYYTGMVFEVFDKNPDNRRALAGGGAYANLLQIFNEQPLPGVGIGLGEPGLVEFLKGHSLLPDLSKASVDVVVSYQVMEAENTAIKLAQDLRSEGLQVEVLFGETKPKKVFSHTDKKIVKFAVFIGSEEMNKSEVQLRNLSSREVANIPSNDLATIVQKVKGNA